MPDSVIKCPQCTHKIIAKERDGKIYVWCKSCKQEVELKIERAEHEPTNP